MGIDEEVQIFHFPINLASLSPCASLKLAVSTAVCLVAAEHSSMQKTNVPSERTSSLKDQEHVAYGNQ